MGSYITIKNPFTIKNFIKVISSAPVIFVVTYFIPVVGVLLLITRYAVYDRNKYFRGPIALFIAALILLIPRGIELANANFNLGISLPFLNDIYAFEAYPKFTDYGKTLLIISIIFIIVSYFMRLIADKISRFFSGVSSKISNASRSYAAEKIASEERIAKENDYRLKEKLIDSKQKTPHVVKCKNCGKANSITGTVGTCKSCRTPIEYHEK